MEEIYDEIRLMLNEGKTRVEIVSFLMTIYGMDQTIADATVVRVKEALDRDGNFKPYTEKQRKRDNLIWYILVAIGCISAMVYVLYSFSKKVGMIIDAILGKPF